MLLQASRANAQLSGGVDELVRELGFAFDIPVTRAIGSAGALMHIARSRLPDGEFRQISEFISGTERLIQQASNVVSGGLPTSIDGMPAVLEKLSLPADSSGEVQEFILQYLRERGGRKIVSLLTKAWRA